MLLLNSVFTIGSSGWSNSFFTSVGSFSTVLILRLSSPLIWELTFCKVAMTFSILGVVISSERLINGFIIASLALMTSSSFLAHLESPFAPVPVADARRRKASATNILATLGVKHCSIGK